MVRGNDVPEWEMLLIPNATNDWTKSWFLPGNQQSCLQKKPMSGTCAFCEQAYTCCMKHAHYSKRMLCEQDCLKFYGRIVWLSFFFLKTALRIPWCSAGKKMKILSSRLWRFELTTSPIVPALCRIVVHKLSVCFRHEGFRLIGRRNCEKGSFFYFAITSDFWFWWRMIWRIDTFTSVQILQHAKGLTTVMVRTWQLGLYVQKS